MLVGRKRHTQNDEELVALYRKTGRKEWVSELFNRYAHLAYGVSLKYLKNEDEAKEAVMILFEKLIRKLAKEEVENFRSWFYVVSKNNCLMILRKAKKTSKNANLDSVQMADPKDDQWLEREEKLTGLETAIQQLKEEQKECVSLFYLKQKSYKEVAEITGFSMREVKTHLQNGRRNLKLVLMKSNETS